MTDDDDDDDVDNDYSVSVDCSKKCFGTNRDQQKMIDYSARPDRQTRVAVNSCSYVRTICVFLQS